MLRGFKLKELSMVAPGQKCGQAPSTSVSLSLQLASKSPFDIKCETTVIFSMKTSALLLFRVSSEEVQPKDFANTMSGYQGFPKTRADVIIPDRPKIIQHWDACHLNMGCKYNT